MTTEARKELQRGSFKGIEFLYREVSESGEMKHIVHEYPNSDKQSVEVLGLRPSSYTIKVVLNANKDLEKKRKLIDAFKLGEKGVFVHPVDGPLNNMIATSWSPNEADSRVGVSVIDVTFKPSGITGLPKPAANQEVQIEKKADEVEDEIAKDVDETFEVSEENPENAEPAKSKLKEFVDKAKEAVEKFAVKVGEKLDEYNAAVEEFNGKINDYLNDPAGLGPDIKNIVVSVAPLIEEESQKLPALSTFFSIGENDAEFIPTTSSLLERKLNNDTINNSVKGIALCESYITSSQTKFTTAQEVETQQSALEDQYQDIRTESGKGDIE